MFCSTKGDIVTLFLRFISLLRKTVHCLVNEVSLIFGHFRNFIVVKTFYHLSWLQTIPRKLGRYAATLGPR